MATRRETNLNPETKRCDDATFSPDGELIAIASSSGYVGLWETVTLRRRATFHGYLMGVHSVAFSPDGKRLAAGSDGQEALKLWDVENHHELLTLAGQGTGFYSSAFSPDGNVLGSMNQAGLLHLWHAASWAEIEAAEMAQKKTP